MMEYNRTITHSNGSVLYNIGPGGWGEKQREVKIANLPNTFDFDCSFIVTSFTNNNHNRKDDPINEIFNCLLLSFSDFGNYNLGQIVLENA